MIVAELIKIQKQRGLTNDQFAESLGIHKVSWLRNKRTRIISGDVVLKAFKVYPEVKDVFLSAFTTAPDEAHQNKNLMGFQGLTDALPVPLKRFFHNPKAKSTVNRCAACGKELEDSADRLGDKSLCSVCFDEGWRLTVITYSSERKSRRLTVAYKLLKRES